jgi:large subunit ribosomal protein LX
MKAFRVTGNYADPRQIRQPFSIEMAAEDEAAVKEKALSTIGSKHKLKRYQIDITDVVEIANDEITNSVVKYQVTGE